MISASFWTAAPDSCRCPIRMRRLRSGQNPLFRPLCLSPMYQRSRFALERLDPHMSIQPEVIAVDAGAVRPVLRDPRAIGMFVFGVVVGGVSMAPEYSRARSPEQPVVTEQQTAAVRSTDIVLPPPVGPTLAAAAPVPRASASVRRVSATARVGTPGHRGTLVVRSTPAGRPCSSTIGRRGG